MDHSKKFYIATPIYYVNDVPHIGHLYTTLACDMIARFKSLDGYSVKFITGTDEHGQKVEKAAMTAGKNPKEFVDTVSQNFRDLATFMQFSHTDFVRTTEPRHYKAAQHIWKELLDRDEIYLGEYAGWYAIRDETYYQESEIIDGKAPTGADVEWVTEPSYFFRLSKWQEPLLKFYKENPDFIAPDSRRNEVLRFVEGGLHDLSVSRASFKWGVPVPGDPAHVMYVWLEALTFYLTALEYPENSEERDEYWANSLLVVGKDILRFQSIYFPAFLLAAGLPPPTRVFAHGWWTIEGEKMSKSLGNVIDPNALVEKYGRDPVRYFLLREIPFGNDGDFSVSALISRLNSDLANSYGNLVQRVLSFIGKTCGGVLPNPESLLPLDEELLLSAKNLITTLRSDIEKQLLHKMIEQIWHLIAQANRYIDEQKPWSLKEEDPARMGTILYVLAETIRQIAILTQPLLPEASARILDQLAIPEDKRTFAHLVSALVPGTTLPAPEGVFPRWVEEKL
ncbi:MAG: methionine--tRNA ligase [Alphaproteobacteria bacterium]|nr:methionine--tRNA ligase [Alphaproteobacteria bacterium]